MDGIVLLIIGLASLGLVFVAFAYCGVKAWRIYRHGMDVYGRLAPFTTRFDEWSVVLEAKAQQLADNGDAITANVERLQATITRLQILAVAINEGMKPVRRARRYLGFDYGGF